MNKGAAVLGGDSKRCRRCRLLAALLTILCKQVADFLYTLVNKYHAQLVPKVLKRYVGLNSSAIESSKQKLLEDRTKIFSVVVRSGKLCLGFDYELN